MEMCLKGLKGCMTDKRFELNKERHEVCKRGKDSEKG